MAAQVKAYMVTLESTVRGSDPQRHVVNNVAYDVSEAMMQSTLEVDALIGGKLSSGEAKIRCLRIEPDIEGNRKLEDDERRGRYGVGLVSQVFGRMPGKDRQP